jgi:hypothetical protein
MHRMIACSLLLFLLPSLAHAETIRLKDGTRLEGTIGAWNAEGTEFYFDPSGQNVTDEPRWIPMSTVAGIRYEGVVKTDRRPSLVASRS